MNARKTSSAVRLDKEMEIQRNRDQRDRTGKLLRQQLIASGKCQGATPLVVVERGSSILTPVQLVSLTACAVLPSGFKASRLQILLHGNMITK